MRPISLRHRIYVVGGHLVSDIRRGIDHLSLIFHAHEFLKMERWEQLHSLCKVTVQWLYIQVSVSPFH